ncbi:antibiotic biosynthesis monooxygenase family protein [Roseateles cellulosilyticus]|uniref:Antibiotic biosynthesis monooxygenase n=1 Tax=Pelomonas cellulosilytica TaxID=2906762 RepID=A0ABS8XWQ1_9BURK|nr:antibiotic biosynthesis monooxygenase family protein [Pelomonas sp. P8]MCE4557079.1 antibiotic biosynthesis monooxygenase [Pelomonas sp. P8]
MPVIRARTPVVTQINVFTVPPGRQQELIDHLAKAALTAREVEGWLSASLHLSFDGTRVVNYAQSADQEAATRVIAHLKAKGLIDGNKAFGEAHPGLYEVVFTLDRENGD